MSLPLKPPYPPMEALPVKKIPTGAGWQYEPKWDGFRCIAFRDGDKVELQSKSGQPLARYFPEVVASLLKLKAAKFVIDGELVIPVGKTISFDDLLMRIHPAASRVQVQSSTELLPSISICHINQASGPECKRLRSCVRRIV